MAAQAPAKTFLHPAKNNVPICLQPPPISPSLHDTRVLIFFLSPTHRHNAGHLPRQPRFNGRKLGTKNRLVVKGHAAPSASTQTMVNLPVFSFELPPGTAHQQ